MPATGNGDVRAGNPIKDERGQYAVVTVLIMAGLLILLGMIVDIGRAYAVRRILQNAVDTAAQAAAHQVDPAFSGRETRLLVSAAMGTAYRYLNRNAPKGVVIESIIVSVDPNTNSVQVTARARVPCTFMRLAGIQAIRPVAVGRAMAVFGLNEVGQ